MRSVDGKERKRERESEWREGGLLYKREGEGDLGEEEKKDINGDIDRSIDIDR